MYACVRCWLIWFQILVEKTNVVELFKLQNVCHLPAIQIINRIVVFLLYTIDFLLQFCVNISPIRHICDISKQSYTIQFVF